MMVNFASQRRDRTDRRRNNADSGEGNGISMNV
jgi:hypothetical protein